jgi:hypothetical protein
VSALRERNRLVQERKQLNLGLPPRPKPVSTSSNFSSPSSTLQTNVPVTPQSSPASGYVDSRLGKSHSRVAMIRERHRQAQERKRRQQDGQ